MKHLFKEIKTILKDGFKSLFDEFKSNPIEIITLIAYIIIISLLINTL